MCPLVADANKHFMGERQNRAVGLRDTNYCYHQTWASDLMHRKAKPLILPCGDR